MHFVYPSGTPFGTVPNFYVPLSTDWATTIEQVFKSINGDEGGTWAPSAFVTIGGAGLQLTGTAHSLAASARLNVESTGEIRVKNGALLRADGTLGDIRLEVSANEALLTAQSGSRVELKGITNVSGDVTLTTAGPGTLTVEDDASITCESGSQLTVQDGGMLAIAGDAAVSNTGVVTFQSGASLAAQSGATGTWNGTWTCGSTLAVTGAATFSSAVTCSSSLSVGTNASITNNVSVGGTLGVTGATAMGGALAVSGVSTFSARTVRTGTGAYAELRSSAGPDASTAIDATDADVWTAPLSADRTWTLNSGPAGKAVVACFVAPPAHQLILAAVGFSATLSRTALSGDYKAVQALWSGAEWLNMGGPTM